MWIKDKNVTMSADKDAVLRCERVIEPENNAHTAGSPVISGRGLVFSAGGRNILDSLDIDVYKGERLVLLGANGCGKTTLMRTLARLNKLTSGTLEQNIVQKPGRRKPNAAWFKKVGFVYQNPTYQLFMPTLLAEASFRASSEQKAREMIEAFGLSGLENRHPQSLSEGQKRRAGLAAICAGEPEVLFLDEPTVGQDYNNLAFIQCACRLTESCASCGGTEKGSKRGEIKQLIKDLTKVSPYIEKNIFRSVENVNLDTVIAYKQYGVKHNFLERYDEMGRLNGASGSQTADNKEME